MHGVAALRLFWKNNDKTMEIIVPLLSVGLQMMLQMGCGSRKGSYWPKRPDGRGTIVVTR